MYRRAGKVLPMVGLTAMLTQLLKEERSYSELCQISLPEVSLNGDSTVDPAKAQIEILKTLEALVSDGWVTARIEPGAEPFPPVNFDLTAVVHANRNNGP